MMENSAPLRTAPATLSIVIPTHNEQTNIGPLIEALQSVLPIAELKSYEVIFCDDSTDSTPQVICALNAQHPWIKLIRFSRSFGQATAICAGLMRATGDIVIIMDADLQDPPTVIPQLIEKWRAGFQIVYVERPSTGTGSLYRLFASLFYKTLATISDITLPQNVGEFRLMDRKVVDVINRMPERTKFLRGLTIWPGFSSTAVQIQRAERLSGETNYNFRRSLLVAIDGLVSFSIFPLRLAAIMGTGCLGLSLLGIIFAVFMRLTTTNWVPGFTLLYVSILFLFGIQFIILGIVGEYIGRIFEEIKGRPLFVTDYEVGFDQS
jgi:glycosyltransferase involved in cell wall biosynthesis